jgi:serine/threonine protein kinase
VVPLTVPSFGRDARVLVATTVPATGTMLGRYQVLKPLAKGGMAEVLLARTIGLGGFARHVVIKRIRVDQGSDQKSIDMFLDEARLVASLHHRNIVQVHDVGEESGKYFFVMEYVHGCDTRELLRRVKDHKAQIPLEHVITIVTAAAAGLHYAHEQRGPDRKPLNIVHRDISPGNILLAFDGGVKVVDFGIAKADARSIQTQAGQTKGKLGYMSPEQCRSLPIDRRTDIFQLGIVLYELCTVRRLFKADSRFETMQLIANETITPPTKWRADIPDDLEHIILKTLAKTPEERYQTADELRLVLEAFASRAGLGLSPGRLSDYLKEQFGEVPEPWLVDEHVPPPPPEVIERIRSSSQLIAVTPPAQTIVETSKPEPIAQRADRATTDVDAMTAESVDAEPMLPELRAEAQARDAESTVAEGRAMAEPAIAEPDIEPTIDEARPAITRPELPTSEARKPDPTRSTQPELEALKAAKPVIAGEPAGPEVDEPAPRRPVVYPSYPTAPRSYRPLLFLAVFLVLALVIGGGIWFLSTELEQTKAAAPALPDDAPAVIVPDAAAIETSTIDAAAPVAIDAAVESPPDTPIETVPAIDAGVQAPPPKPRPRPVVKPKPKPKATPADVTPPQEPPPEPEPAAPAEQP